VRRGALLAGRYELMERLGRGGMGEVWSGRDRRLQRRVALKLLELGDGVEPDLPARFEREAVAAAQINHPNIVALHDRGVHDDLLFLVMEKVEGESLGALVDRAGALPLDHALDLGEEICAGLEAAHGAGVVHCDIKPHNVMLTADGRAKIVDFGIAGFLRANPSLVRTSQLAPAGTPEFAAPEQFDERGDERSDLYALGGVLFAMLTGRPPFRGANPWAVMAVKQTEDAPRLEDLRPGVPPRLAELVAALLAREPAERPPTASEVRGRLRLLRSAADAAPPPDPRRPHPGLGARQTRLIDSATDAAAQVNDPDTRARLLARIQEEVATADPALARSIAERIEDQLRRDQALLRIAALNGDIDDAVRIARRPAFENLGGLALAAAVDDLAGLDRAQRLALLDRAEPLIPKDVPDTDTAIAVAAHIARLWCDLDFPRAAGWLDRVQQQLIHLEGPDGPEFADVCRLVDSLTRHDPARARVLAAHLLRAAGTPPMDSHHPPGRSLALAKCADAVRTVDPDSAELLVDLAERTAAELSDPPARDRALREIAEELAAADPERAEHIIRVVTDGFRIGVVWEELLGTAAESCPGRIPHLIDVAVQSLPAMPPGLAGEAEQHEPAAMRRGFLRRRLRPAHPSRPRPGRPGSFGRDQSIADVATAIAPFDPARADMVAAQVRHQYVRIQMLAGMARTAAATSPGQAVSWLRSAHREAAACGALTDGTLTDGTVTHGARTVRDTALLELVAAAAALEPALARRIAGEFLGQPRIDQASAHTLATLANHLTDADAGMAERLVDLAIDQRSLDDADHHQIARALIGLAARAEATDPARGARLLHRAQQAAHAISVQHWRSDVWSDAAALLDHAPATAAQLVAQYHGHDRDDMLQHIVPALTAAARAG
jgi:serine/threonine-protein kinase